jgi:hypothetical protein
LTEANEVRAFRDESEEQAAVAAFAPEIPHAAPGALQAVRTMVKGHDEQTVIPDDCQFDDNDLCHVNT